jgi:hypothetical protein
MQSKGQKNPQNESQVLPAPQQHPSLPESENRGSITPPMPPQSPGVEHRHFHSRWWTKFAMQRLAQPWKDERQQVGHWGMIAWRGAQQVHGNWHVLQG